MKTSLTLLAGFTLIATGCGPQADGFPTRSFARPQRDLDPLPYEDRDVKPAQLEGKWTAVYDGPNLNVDRVSTSGEGTLEIDFQKQTYAHHARYWQLKNEKKTSTIELSEVGKTVFFEQGDLVRFAADRSRSLIKPQHADLVKAMNAEKPAGYCDVTSWRVDRERFLDEIGCASAFQPSTFSHVKSVSEKELVLEHCLQKSVGGRAAYECKTVKYIR